jgi:asparagine synthase (glutamine-hydrolysing)
MCGIVGIADFRQGGRPDPRLVAGMTDTLAHRGPDGACLVEIGSADGAGLAFGFRRLSIIDLGVGARAYADEAGRFRVICNGEIYNHPELRRDLESRGHRFETRCDTEVIPHLYEEHGIDFVSRLNGMFAFAIFDIHEQRLVLGRDRAGEKPLYYLEQGGELMFASEIKALLAHPRVSRQIDLHALTRYLMHGYFPAPHTPFVGVRKLAAGHLLIAERGTTRLEQYWNLRGFFESPARAVVSGGTPSEREAVEEVGRLLAEGVALRLRADVPVGVFFSGGLDSSSIAAFAVEQSSGPVPTFTLGMDDPDFNESEYARRAAAHLGTEHHEMIVGEREMHEALLTMAQYLDEPLADASLLPTYLLSRFARRHVKVTLGGEGGDELFAGYPTYLGDRLARTYNLLPRAVRALVRGAVERVQPSFSNVGIEFLLKRFVAAADLPQDVRHQVWFGAFSPERQKTLLSDAALDTLASGPADDPLREARAAVAGFRGRDPLDALLLTDFLLYLQDDLLTKVDRASMATSLEVRAPFLHHPLVEYVAGLPASMKLRGLTGKHLLKRAMASRLTREITSRRKRGFNIPLARLMHRGLAPLLARALDPGRVARGGILRPEAVTALLREHQERRRDNGRILWNLLMLQLWQSRHFDDGELLNVTPMVVRSL